MSSKASHLVRRARVPGILRAVLAAAAVTLTGCAKEATEPQRVILPGFSVELPAGKVLSTSTNATGGKHSVSLPSPSWRDALGGSERADRELEVHWSANSMTRDIWSSQLIPALVPKLPAAGLNPKVLEERVVAADRWLYMVGTESTPVSIGIVNCDVRFMVLVTYVRFSDRARQADAMRRILESVQCAVTEANRARPIPATRLPEKFGRVASPEALLYRSLDGETLSVSVGNTNLQKNPEVFREVIGVTVNAVLGMRVDDWQYLKDTTSQRNFAILRGLAPELGKNVYFGALYCEPADLSVMMMWIGPDPSDDLARERFSQVGCPGEPSTISPDFSELAP